MSLTHDEDYTYGGITLHSLIKTDGDYDMNIVTGQFMGVNGESHLIDETKGRVLSCTVMMTGYTTQSEIKSAIATIRAKKGKLTGTLTQDIGEATSQIYNDTTFISFETQEPFYDGKRNTTDKWCCKGRLTWRQRKRG